jgi:hypothetical protein
MIIILLADASRFASDTIVAYSVNRHSKEAANLAPLALPTTLGTFSNLPFLIGGPSSITSEYSDIVFLTLSWLAQDGG